MEIISLSDEYKEKVERIVDESYSGMKIAVHRELFFLLNEQPFQGEIWKSCHQQ